MGIEGRTGHRGLRPLTKSELDRSLQRVAEELALFPDSPAEEPVPALRPRWIAAAELVRRISRFTGQN